MINNVMPLAFKRWKQDHFNPDIKEAIAELDLKAMLLVNEAEQLKEKIEQADGPEWIDYAGEVQIICNQLIYLATEKAALYQRLKSA